MLGYSIKGKANYSEELFSNETLNYENLNSNDSLNIPVNINIPVSNNKIEN
jgi:hypothetical protein